MERYLLLDEIGRGNMGVVYKGRDTALDRIVAVKIIRVAFALDKASRRIFLERFHREARIAGKLAHPGIVAVHDAGFRTTPGKPGKPGKEDEAESEPFIVMEYFQGTSLSQIVGKRRFPPEEILEIVRQLATALGYAHDQGVVHRDIKPANVLFQPGPRIKLVDFGIAKVEASELTATGEFIGTPSYMSPEIFSGAPIDARSDLFSVGVLLYQLLTGRRPFQGENVSQTIYRVLHEDPEPPSACREGLGREWDFVCSKLLAKDPESRYQKADELVSDLDAIESGCFEIAGGEPPTVPIQPSWSLRRRVLTWITLGLATIVVILAVSTDSGRESPRYEPPESRRGAVAVAASEPPTVDPPPRVPAEELSYAFVARHEHRIGHCTGDLRIDSEAIVFETSRHGTWSWTYPEVRRLTAPSETEMELLALSRERGHGDETERYVFTFLRPSLAREDFERVTALVAR